MERIKRVAETSFPIRLCSTFFSLLSSLSREDGEKKHGIQEVGRAKEKCAMIDNLRYDACVS